LPNYYGQDLPLHDIVGIRKQSALKEAEEPAPDERTVTALKLTKELGLTDELAARCVGQ
jgi:hypothetical protein